MICYVRRFGWSINDRQTPMEVLEELKKQARALRKQQDTDSQWQQKLGEYNRTGIIAGLRLVHEYLHDLIEQFYLVKPEISTDFTIENIGTLSGLQQQDYELFFECKEKSTVLTLAFCIKKTESFDFEIQDEKNAREQLTQLIRNGLLAELSSAEKDSRPFFTIQAYVPIKLIFKSDFSLREILMTIQNVDHLGFERHSLNPDQINPAFLDQLGRYLMRRNNDFLKQIESGENSQTIARRSASAGGGNEEDSSMHTQEMDSTRIRSLFNREQRLYLTYRNTIKEVSTKSSEFVLGRSRSCDFVIESDLASRQHARLLYRKGKYVLIDQSTNGTFIKTQGGKEVYLQGEEYPLSGSGFISLGKSVTVDNEHLIYFSCQ